MTEGRPAYEILKCYSQRICRLHHIKYLVSDVVKRHWIRRVHLHLLLDCLHQQGTSLSHAMAAAAAAIEKLVSK